MWTEDRDARARWHGDPSIPNPTVAHPDQIFLGDKLTAGTQDAASRPLPVEPVAAALAPFEALGGAMRRFGLTLGTLGPVAPELVDYFRAQLEGHYRADMVFGPHLLSATVVTQYWLIDELADAATGDVRRDLPRLAAAYAALAGWLYQDTDDLSLSSSWRSQALEMAHRCHDPLTRQLRLDEQGDAAQ